MKLGSLCSGVGMLDQAVLELFPARHAWVAETDPHATLVLEQRIGCPNLGDITAVDWTTVEPVDILVAGYPCQDISNAGKRAGIGGARSGIWSNVADAIRDLRPSLVLLENVAAHIARGFGRVLGDLAAIRYDARWVCLRASDVGAPHQRDRVFIAATPADADSRRVRIEPVPVGARRRAAVSRGDRAGTLMPTPVARDWKGPGYAGQLSTALLPTPTSTNAHGNHVNNRGELLLPGAVADLGRWEQYLPAIARWELAMGPAPEPTILGPRGGRRLSAEFVEWLMGWPAGYVTGLTVNNSVGLRLCGNGVVPQQAVAAYRSLLEAS